MIDKKQNAKAARARLMIQAALFDCIIGNRLSPGQELWLHDLGFFSPGALELKWRLTDAAYLYLGEKRCADASDFFACFPFSHAYSDHHKNRMAVFSVDAAARAIDDLFLELGV